MQLRGAISTRKKPRVDDEGHKLALDESDRGFGRDNEGSLEEEGLDLLEDSLIGNDVVLEECKRQSQQLQALLRKVMCKDRCVCVCEGQTPWRA
jgi:hypothetical protein